jgi:hypothetical protein
MKLSLQCECGLIVASVSDGGLFFRDGVTMEAGGYRCTCGLLQAVTLGDADVADHPHPSDRHHGDDRDPA